METRGSSTARKRTGAEGASKELGKSGGARKSNPPVQSASGADAVHRPKSKAIGAASRLSKEASRKALFEESGLDRVAMIRQGVPAAQVVSLSDALAIPRDRLFNVLQLPRSTVDRKIRDKARLSPEQSERVIGLERLIGQVEAMVADSDISNFDAGRWVGDWLDRPLPALGGAKPGDYLDTMEGQQMVARLLAQTQSGAYG